MSPKFELENQRIASHQFRSVLRRSTRRAATSVEALEPRRLFAAGFLDSSFGTNGVSELQVGSTGNDATSVAQQSNGQLIVVGDAVSGNAQSAFIGRLNADGSPDTTYGTGGTSLLRLTGQNTIATGVGIDPTTGDAVVCGVFGGNTSSSKGSGGLAGLLGISGSSAPSLPSGLAGMAFIAKFDTNGNPVSGFGTQGVVTFAPFSGSAAASDVWVEPNGTIAVSGTSASKYGVGIMFGLFNSDGSVMMVGGGPDENAFEPASGHAAIGTKIAKGTSNGEYVVSGFDINLASGQIKFEVVEFGNDAGVVGSFGNNGVATASFGNKVEPALGVTVDPTTGDIYAAGSTANGLIQLVPGLPSAGSAGHATSGQFAIASFNPDGSLNTAFNGTGMQTVSFSAGALAGASTILEEPNGDLLVAGSVETGPKTADIASARLLPSGALDSTYADAGTSAANLYGSAGVFSATLAQASTSSQSLGTQGVITPASTHYQTYEEFFVGHIKSTILRLTAPLLFDVSTPQAVSNPGKAQSYIAVGELTSDSSSETANPGPTPMLTSTLAATLPTAAISGTKAKGFKATVTITSSGQVPASGAATLNVYLSTTPTYSAGTATALTPISLNLNLAPGRSIKEPIKLANYPMGLNGSYYLLTQLSGGGNASVVSAVSASTINIGPAFVNLENLGVSATPTTIARGKKKLKISTIVENGGNTPDNGAMGISISLSQSNTGSGAVPLDTMLSSQLNNLAPGKKKTISESLAIPTTFAAGNYFVVVTIDPANTFQETSLADNTIVDQTMSALT